MPSHRGRPIETVTDARGILESTRASAAELLECIEIAKADGAADVVEKAGTELLRRATGKRQIPALRIAARAIILRYLAETAKLENLTVGLDDARAALERLLREGLDDGASAIVDESLRWLEELRALLSDGTAASLVSVCSRLRAIDRSDLGVDAATRAIALDPDSGPAYTTRAAARLDRGDHPRALADLEKAWKLDPSSHAAAAFSRAYLAAGRPDLAIEKAKEAFTLDPSEVSAHTLLRAAAQASDEAAMAEAKHFIASHDPGVQVTRPSIWVEIVSIRALLEMDKLDEAEAAIGVLKADPRLPTHELNNLKGRLKTLRRRRQNRLDL